MFTATELLEIMDALIRDAAHSGKMAKQDTEDCFWIHRKSKTLLLLDKVKNEAEKACLVEAELFTNSVMRSFDK